jgi:hypothetical protein
MGKFTRIEHEKVIGDIDEDELLCKRLRLSVGL